ncbi:MAG TPA: hypothetical protein VKC56_04205 [Gallionellaceae bacterium]|nr:hypothetical protein [Gallionellaceae bacterium]
MNTREKTLNLVKMYKEHQRQFEAIFAALGKAAAPGNDYGIEIRGGTEIAKEFTIVSHPCRMVFDIRLDSESFPGKASFLRVLGPEQAQGFLNVYFDRSGNLTDDSQASAALHAVADAATPDWLALRVLDEFFRSRETGR